LWGKVLALWGHCAARPLVEGSKKREAVPKYTFHPLMTLITQIFIFMIPKGYYLSAQSAESADEKLKEAF